MSNQTRSEAQGRTREQLEASLSRSRILNVILGAVAAFLAVIVAAQMFNKPSDEPAPEPVEAVAEETDVVEAPEAEATQDEVEFLDEGDYVRRDPDDPMAIGDVDAPVVMTEWLDFQCPYCSLFAEQTLPTLVEEYVDKGKLRIEFVDVSYFGEGSTEGAAAARAAAEQGMYFEYMNAIYDLPEDTGELNSTKLMDLAEQVGIPDMAKFEEDYQSPETRAFVAASTEEAQQRGVQSVPFFAIFDVSLAGAQPLEVFESFVNEALAHAESK